MTRPEIPADAWIKPDLTAPPSYLELLAQGGYAAMCAALSGITRCDCGDPECGADSPLPWAELSKPEQRAFTAFAAGVIVAEDANAAQGAPAA